MIDVKNISKAFDEKSILQDVNLTVAGGESCVIIGGSGAGKSVLLKCMLGLMRPDTGTISIDGAAPGPQLMDRIGMLFQGGALFDSLPVWQNVAFKLLRQFPREAAKARAIEKLAQVGLSPDIAELYPADLSGGMQKRVGLARAIAADPDILFFDEPTTGLDPIMAGAINDLIRSVVDELKVTAITITHDMTSVRAIADQVAFLHAGAIRWSGSQSDMEHADEPYLQQFIHGAQIGPIQTTW